MVNFTEAKGEMKLPLDLYQRFEHVFDYENRNKDAIGIEFTDHIVNGNEVTVFWNGTGRWTMANTLENVLSNIDAFDGKEQAQRLGKELFEREIPIHIEYKDYDPNENGFFMHVSGDLSTLKYVNRYEFDASKLQETNYPLNDKTLVMHDFVPGKIYPSELDLRLDENFRKLFYDNLNIQNRFVSYDAFVKDINDYVDMNERLQGGVTDSRLKDWIKYPDSLLKELDDFQKSQTNDLLKNLEYSFTGNGVEITGFYNNLQPNDLIKETLILPNTEDFRKAGVISGNKKAYISSTGLQKILSEAGKNHRIRNFMISDTDGGKLVYNSPSMDSFFSDLPSESYINGLFLNNLDVSQVEDMSYLFSCDGLMQNITDLEIEDWDVSNVRNMSGMFNGFDVSSARNRLNPYNDRPSTLNLSKWDVSNVEDMSYMFAYSDLNEINTSGWNTYSVEDMSAMFYRSPYLEKIGGIENWDTSKVKNMSEMFDDQRNGSKLEKLNLSKWDVSNVEDMSSMFSNQNLKQVDLRSWDTHSVEDMRDMFFRAKQLQKIDGLSDLNVSNVKNMKNIFVDTKNIKELDLSKWKFNPECDLRGIMLGSGVQKIKTPDPVKSKTPNKITVKKPAKRSR